MNKGANSSSKTAKPAKSRSGKTGGDGAALNDRGSAPEPIVGVTSEAGQEIEAPPPELLEADPALSAEEAEQVRKDYLLTRFWISARGFWSKSGDRLAWVFTIGLLALIVTNVGFQYGINVWNRAIFDAIEKRNAPRVLHLSGVFFPLAMGSVLLGVAQVYARMGTQRRWRAWLERFPAEVNLFVQMGIP